MRGSDAGADRRRLPADEAAAFAASRLGTDWLQRRMGAVLGDCVRAGRIDPRLAAAMDINLSGIAAVVAGCERIKVAPIPFAYTLRLHRTATLSCFLLPFGLVEQIGFMKPMVTAIVVYTFFGLATRSATRSRSRSAWPPTTCGSTPCAARSRSTCSKRSARPICRRRWRRQTGG